MGMKMQAMVSDAHIFRQSCLASRALLDEVVGEHFALCRRHYVIPAALERVCGKWQTMDITTIADGAEGVDGWTSIHGAGAVPPRPERYVVGISLGTPSEQSNQDRP